MSGDKRNFQYHEYDSLGEKTILSLFSAFKRNGD